MPGGVQMADVTTLMLTERLTQAVRWRGVSMADGHRNGAGYEQVLSGDNAYTGSTVAGACHVMPSHLREDWPITV